MEKCELLSPSVLAFVGDAVYGLLVREHIAKINRPSKDLHSLSVKWVSAPAQNKAYEIIEPILTENEEEIFKRGRNFHTGNIPKNATSKEYHTATGLECLFGFLHLSGKKERINELFEIIAENHEE